MRNKTLNQSMIQNNAQSSRNFNGFNFQSKLSVNINGDASDGSVISPTRQLKLNED